MESQSNKEWVAYVDGIVKAKNPSEDIRRVIIFMKNLFEVCFELHNVDPELNNEYKFIIDFLKKKTNFIQSEKLHKFFEEVMKREIDLKDCKVIFKNFRELGNRKDFIKAMDTKIKGLKMELIDLKKKVEIEHADVDKKYAITINKMIMKHEQVLRSFRDENLALKENIKKMELMLTDKEKIIKSQSQMIKDKETIIRLMSN
jgi:hypothetical protein